MRTEFEVVTAPALRRLFEERGVMDAIEAAEQTEAAENAPAPEAEPQESTQEKTEAPSLGDEEMHDISRAEAERVEGSADSDENQTAADVREEEIDLMSEDMRDAVTGDAITEDISAALSGGAAAENAAHASESSAPEPSTPERTPEDVSKYEISAWAKKRYEKRHNKRRIKK